MDRNALDWLFSTAPQAIAALVGLIFTGVSFIIGAIDREIARDDTKTEICESMKQDIHSKMKWLYWLAGVSVILDLIIIVLNPIQNDKTFSFSGLFDWLFLIDGLILLLNLITIGFSLWFIVWLAHPNFFKETANRMIDKEKGDVEIKDYITSFIDFEKALRNLPLNITIESQQIQRNASVSEMLRELKYRGWLDTKEIDELYRLNRLRNLAIHGALIDRVDNESYLSLKRYTEKLIELRNRL